MTNDELSPLKWPDGYLLLPGMREAFDARVLRGKPDECWPWKGGHHERGYGHFWLTRRNLRANRVAFFYANGYFPTEARHSCDNPPCCNPSHIVDGTHRDNMHDCLKRGRMARGERVGLSKLTSEQVIAIRHDRRSSRVIAREYGVGKSTIGNLKRGDTWNHL